MKAISWVFGLLLGTHLSQVLGEIVIDRTRVIYPATAREVTVNLHNPTDSPRLVQAWIDGGDPQVPPESSDAPFTLTPPILRLEPGKGRALRLMYQPEPGHPTASAVESVFWLNVLGIRPSFDTPVVGNHMQFAFRSRIKLFLRPDGLPGLAEEAGQSLHWRLERAGPVLQVHNPSAFHVTLSRVGVTVAGTEYRHDNPPMLVPQSTTQIALTGRGMPRQGDAMLHFTTLDDQGQAREHAVSLSSAVRHRDKGQGGG